MFIFFLVRVMSGCVVRKHPLFLHRTDETAGCHVMLKINEEKFK